MIKKYILKNKSYLYSFFFFILSLFTISSIIIMKTDGDIYNDLKKNCVIGNMYILNINDYEQEKYEKLFKSKLYAVYYSDLLNVYRDTYPMHYGAQFLPIFFTENEYYDNEFCIDYNSYVFNNYIDSISINGTTMKINTNDFSSTVGLFINENAVKNLNIKKFNKYAIKLTKENVNLVCKYGTKYGCYVADYLGEFNYDHNVQNENNYKNLSLAISIVSMLLFIIILFNYTIKNYHDYYLLYVNGYNKLNLFYLSIPIISLICATPISMIPIYFYKFIYNQTIPKKTLSINFGIISLTLLTFTIILYLGICLCSLLFLNYILKRKGDKNV